MATRAQAVSSTETALSGNWRPWMYRAESFTAADNASSRSCTLWCSSKVAGHAAQHADRRLLLRLVHLHDLEAAGERGVLLDVLLVLRPCRRGDRAQGAAGERGLEQVRGIARPGGSAGADQRVRLVDEQDDALAGGLHLLDHRLQPVLELAPDGGAGLHGGKVEREEPHIPQGRRHVAGGDSQRQTFDKRGLADAGLADHHRVVLPAPHQDVDDLADLAVAALHRVDAPGLGLRGEVGRELVERGFAAVRRGRVWRDAGGGGGGELRRDRVRLLGRAARQLLEAVDDRGRIQGAEGAGGVREEPPQFRRLQHAVEEVRRADAGAAEDEAGADPAALDRQLQVAAEVETRGARAAKTL